MNTPSNAVPGPSLSAAVPPTRSFLWSVRRELWENRSLYLVPLIAGGLALVGFLWGSRHLPEKVRNAAAVDPAFHQTLLTAAHDYVAVLLILVTGFTALYYCLDTLYGERRDRSILFWKSLPVSDLTTVLSKAFIPLVALPAIAFVVIIATQLAMLLLGSVIVLASGDNPAVLWAQVPVFRNVWVLVYGLFTLAIWYAPVYGWLFVVSAWAQRAPFLWAVLPPIVLVVLEKLAFNTTYVATVLRSRLSGGFSRAFAVAPKESADALSGGSGADHMAQAFSSTPDPVKFLTSPAVWIGVGVAVALFALAVWLRRRRDPI